MHDLKQIAEDLYKDKIFSDRHLRNPETELSMVFLVLNFMSKEEAKKFIDTKPAFIYEYYDKAAPRSINGYPMFFLLKSLNQKEFNEMWKYYEKIKASVGDAIKD